MTPPEVSLIVVASIAAIATLGAAVIVALTARAQRRADRMAQLEKRVDQLEQNENLLHLWARQLVDHIYRGNPPPPPPPPPGLFKQGDST